MPDAQTVTEVKHYTDRLFSFKGARPASLPFRSGEFVMIGLMGDPVPATGTQKTSPAGLFDRIAKMGRITDLMRSGEAFDDLGVPVINALSGRAMVCGNLAFNIEIKEMLESFGLEEGANSNPKTYVFEKAFLG